MTTRLHTLAAVAMLLGFGVSTPALSASATYQKAGDSGSIELSNLDGDDAYQTPLLNEAAVNPGDIAARAPGEGAGVVIAGRADATEFQPRPKRGELSVTKVTTDGKNPVAIPMQQQVQDLMLQQAAFNGGPNGNQFSARKYLKVDRASFLSGLNN